MVTNPPALIQLQSRTTFLSSFLTEVAKKSEQKLFSLFLSLATGQHRWKGPVERRKRTLLSLSSPYDYDAATSHVEFRHAYQGTQAKRLDRLPSSLSVSHKERTNRTGIRSWPYMWQWQWQWQKGEERKKGEESIIPLCCCCCDGGREIACLGSTSLRTMHMLLHRPAPSLLSTSFSICLPGF